MYAADVIRSVQDTGWGVIVCYSLTRTLNQACLASPHKFNVPLQDEKGGEGEAFLFGQRSTQMGR